MKVKPRLTFLFIVLFQVLILAGLVGFNEAAIATGKTVVLQTVPVDPRDIFRGDYVALRYEISRLKNVPGLELIKEGGRAYVHLGQHGNVWEAVEVSDARVKGWEVVISGEVTGIYNGNYEIKYGIEEYFVPEDKGLEIQRAEDIKVLAIVDGSGRAMIKNLMVDGEIFQP